MTPEFPEARNIANGIGLGRVLNMMAIQLLASQLLDSVNALIETLALDYRIGYTQMENSEPLDQDEATLVGYISNCC
jgi:hypothetical protein